jgi:hypothetical protein
MPKYTILEIKSQDGYPKRSPDGSIRCVWILESEDMVDNILARYVWAHWPHSLGPQPPRNVICERHIDAYFEELEGIEYPFIHPPEPLLTTLGTKIANAGLKALSTLWLTVSSLAAISRMLTDGVNWMDTSVAAVGPIILILGALTWNFEKQQRRQA